MSFDLKISKSSEEFTSVKLLFCIIGHKTGDLLYLVCIQELPVVSTHLARWPISPYDYTDFLLSQSMRKATEKRASHFIKLLYLKMFFSQMIQFFKPAMVTSNCGCVTLQALYQTDFAGFDFGQVSLVCLCFIFIICEKKIIKPIHQAFVECQSHAMIFVKSLVCGDFNLYYD